MSKEKVTSPGKTKPATRKSDDLFKSDSEIKKEAAKPKPKAKAKAKTPTSFQYAEAKEEGAPAAAPNDLQRVVKLANLLAETQAAQAEAEATVAELKQAADKLAREDIPSLMEEIGVEKVTLSGGQQVSIKQEIECGISKDNKPKAFAWLIEHGFGGLIKTLVEVQFGKGEHEQAEQTAAKLRQQFKKNTVEVDESVHPATLKSFVKERMEAGEPVPQDLFGVFPYRKAIITKA